MNKESIKAVEESSTEKITCGLIMPISKIDGYSTEHWVEVENILSDSIKSIEQYEIDVNIVSNADDAGVIQKRIVQNLYDSNIVICDVSAKNPNVMFELGMRLAFDKPTIIIKDDITDYSFDTSVIEHISYPKDLRFQSIVDFKNKLADKVLATYEKSISDPEYSTFLKNFGKFEIAKIEETAVKADLMVIHLLNELQRDVSNIKNEGLGNINIKKNELKNIEQMIQKADSDNVRAHMRLENTEKKFTTIYLDLERAKKEYEQIQSKIEELKNDKK